MTRDCHCSLLSTSTVPNGNPILTFEANTLQTQKLYLGSRLQWFRYGEFSQARLPAYHTETVIVRTCTPPFTFTNHNAAALSRLRRSLTQSKRRSDCFSLRSKIVSYNHELERKLTRSDVQAASLRPRALTVGSDLSTSSSSVVSKWVAVSPLPRTNPKHSLTWERVDESRLPTVGQSRLYILEQAFSVKREQCDISQPCVAAFLQLRHISDRYP